MSELLWTPQEHLGRATWGFAQQSRIRGFLGLSTVVHLAAAALSPWLFLTFALSGREEQLVIRSVDFFPAPEAAPLATGAGDPRPAGERRVPPKAAGRAGHGEPARAARDARPRLAAVLGRAGSRAAGGVRFGVPAGVRASTGARAPSTPRCPRGPDGSPRGAAGSLRSCSALGTLGTRRGARAR